MSAAINLSHFWENHGADPGKVIIARKFFDTIDFGALTKMEPEWPRFFIHFMGAPGAGKTTLAKKLEAFFRNYPDMHYWTFMRLDFDDIMTSIPDYQEAFLTDPAQAYADWVLPARVVGYEVLQELISNHVSVIFDHSGADERHVGLLEETKRSMQTRLLFVRASVPTMLDRVNTREVASKARIIPASLVTERAAKLATLASVYEQLFHVVTVANEDGDEADMARIATDLQISGNDDSFMPWTFKAA